MNATGILSAAIFLAASSCLAPSQTPLAHSDLSSLQRVLESTYHLRARQIPGMGMVNSFARLSSKGTVHSVRVLTYESLPTGVDPQQVADLAKAHLSAEWSLMIQDSTSTKEGDTDLVFVQPAGKRMRLLVVDLEPDELGLVQMDLSPDDLKKWEAEHTS